MGILRKWRPYLAMKASGQGSRASAYMRLMGPKVCGNNPSASRTFAVVMLSGLARNTTWRAKASSRGHRYTASCRVPHSRANDACHTWRRSFSSALSSRRTCASIDCSSRRSSSLSSSYAGGRGPSPHPKGADGPGSCNLRTTSRRLGSLRGRLLAHGEETLPPKCIVGSLDHGPQSSRGCLGPGQQCRHWDARHAALART